jgi:hypothetical protein
MNIKDRIKLYKLAQTVQTTPIATVSNPPSFIASQVYGWIPSSYNSETVKSINGLVSLINSALHYSTNGQTNFQQLRDAGFQIDLSSMPSTDAKNLANLAMIIYNYFLNKGNKPGKLTPAIINSWCQYIQGCQAFLNLSQIAATSLVSQKIKGNLQDLINNYLRNIMNYNQ